MVTCPIRPQILSPIAQSMHGPVVLPRPLRSLAAALLLACALVPFAAGAAAPAAAPAISAFSLDPHTVQRWQAGWRHPQAGWTVVHIEGAPYERGLQHGHLLAAEIADYIRALSAFWGPNAPAVACRSRSASTFA